MKRDVFRLILVLLGLHLGIGQANAANEHLYLIPGLSYIAPDDNRRADKNSIPLGYQIGIGTRYDESFNLELTLVADTITYQDETNKYGQLGVLLDALYFPWPDNEVSPYGVLGVGMLKTSIGAEKRQNPMTNIGVGFMNRLFLEGVMGLRGDVRYRMDETGFLGKKRFSDWLVNVSLIVPLQ